MTLCRVHKMAYVRWVWCHTYSWSETINGDVVMTQIWWMPFQIYWEWCHEHSACDVINNLVWCHQMWTWYVLQCIWYYTYSGCDVLYTKGVISLKEWVWWHTFSAVMSYTMDMMSSYIANEISKIQLLSYHQYIGCDGTYTVDMMSNTVGVMS